MRPTIASLKSDITALELHIQNLDESKRAIEKRLDEEREKFRKTAISMCELLQIGSRSEWHEIFLEAQKLVEFKRRVEGAENQYATENRRLWYMMRVALGDGSLNDESIDAHDLGDMSRGRNQGNPFQSGRAF